MSKNILRKSLVTLFVFVLIVLAVVVPKLRITEDSHVQGSVTQGNEYMSTTTRSFNGTALTNFTVLRNIPGALGSVVITGANTGILRIHDATTTNALLRTNTATTTLADFPASTAAGTYTFDVVANYGLVYEIVSGNAPTSTITWR